MTKIVKLVNAVQAGSDQAPGYALTVQVLEDGRVIHTGTFVFSRDMSRAQVVNEIIASLKARFISRDKAIPFAGLDGTEL